MERMEKEDIKIWFIGTIRRQHRSLQLFSDKGPSGPPAKKLNILAI
jgi:hypothetical protein